MPHDRHVLYEAAVQGAEYDIDMFQRMYRKHRGRRFTRLREDFCGTAAVAAAWARRRPENEAWGVDLDREVLEWARTHRLPYLRRAADRVHLVRADVRASRVPPVDFVCAMNFSYWVFHRRADLVAYFRSVHRSLRAGGVFACNAFGGTGAEKPLVERTRVPGSQSADGERVPAFTYVWRQTKYNAIDHHLLCQIDFELEGRRPIRRAFHYDWRLWTLPELRDALTEAGFRTVHFYVEGWDGKKNSPDEHFRLRTWHENKYSWLACAVALK